MTAETKKLFLIVIVGFAVILAFFFWVAYSQVDFMNSQITVPQSALPLLTSFV